MTQNIKEKPREIIFIKEKSPPYLKDHLSTENLNLSKFELVFCWPVRIEPLINYEFNTKPCTKKM